MNRSFRGYYSSVALTCPKQGPGSDRRVEIRILPEPRKVARLRRALETFPLPPLLLDDAKLLLTETVTNSIRHAQLRPRERVRIAIRWDGTTLRVDVFDHANAGAEPGPVIGGIRPSPGAESGWGLFLLDRLARRWGNAPGHYWFELTL
ncbi:MAG TPA: ATP-binding protein [Actinomycetota bacterium]